MKNTQIVLIIALIAFEATRCVIVPPPRMLYPMPCNDSVKGVIDAGQSCIGSPREMDKGFQSYFNGYDTNHDGIIDPIENIQAPSSLLYSNLNSVQSKSKGPNRLEDN